MIHIPGSITNDIGDGRTKNEIGGNHYPTGFQIANIDDKVRNVHHTSSFSKKEAQSELFRRAMK